ncbi:MAG: sialate O-acetylesterase [Akkermansia sp.]|nr:sialate O-acetylesterase [Akkermansia sp.]
MWARFLLSLLLCSCALADVLHVYILTGQSNSLGAVKGDPLPEVLLAEYSTGQGGAPVLMWNGNMSGSVSANEASKNLVVPDAGKTWEPVAPQLPAYGSKCMGPEFGFAYAMRRITRENIAVIKCSRDGGGNEQWAKGQSLYGLLVNSVNTALAAVDKRYDKVSVEGVMYLQGESNRSAAGADEKFLAFWRDLSKDIKAKRVKAPLKAAVVGECATWGSQNNDTVKATALAMRRMAEADAKHMGFVVTRDLDKITAGDGLGVHYDGVSQLTIGARYAYQMARLRGAKADGRSRVRSQWYEGAQEGTPIYLNDARAWWHLAAPKKALSTAQQTAVWDLSSANMLHSAQGTELLSADWSVGGIRIEDPYSEDDSTGIRNATVTIAPAEGATPELRLGQGGIELQHGHLALRVPVCATAPQTWRLGAGRTLELSALPQGDSALHLVMESGATLKWPAEPLSIAQAELAADSCLLGGAADGTLFTGLQSLIVGGTPCADGDTIPVSGGTLHYANGTLRMVKGEVK